MCTFGVELALPDHKRTATCAELATYKKQARL